MNTLRVVGWINNFENNRTRDLKRMDWVPVPNKMDGDGYTELLDHPSGAAHFGCWIALIEIASKCEPRGTLVRDGGKLHDAGSLSRLSRIPAALFEEAIPRLIDMGWMEEAEELSAHPFIDMQESRTKPQEGAAKRHEGAALTGARRTERNGMEGNGMEGKQPAAQAPPAANVREFKKPETAPLPSEEPDVIFERIYRKHPKRGDYGLAMSTFGQTVGSGVDAHEIERVHALFCEIDWPGKEGRFAPTLAKWLIDRGWEYPPNRPETTESPPGAMLSRKAMEAKEKRDAWDRI